MARERDSQRSKVYKAERASASWFNMTRMWNRDTNRRVEVVHTSGRYYAAPADVVAVEWLGEMPEVRAFVRRLEGSAWYRRNYPRAASHPINVQDGRAQRNATGGRHGIDMPRWSRSRLIVCHELAHTTTIREFGSQTAAHGWRFCSVYLAIVRHMMGAAAHDDLKASFKAHKVRFTEPSTRQPVSAERRAVLVAQLARAREAKAASAR